jgi:hypothetical protein
MVSVGSRPRQPAEIVTEIKYHNACGEKKGPPRFRV